MSKSITLFFVGKYNMIIKARHSEFRKFLQDLLSDLYDIHIQEYQTGIREFSPQYPFLGSLILYKLVIIDDENLDISVSTTMNPNENSEIHCNRILNEIKKKFRSGDLPLAFQDLIPDEKYLKLMKERWEESDLTQRAEAYLSTIVLLGSILESLLLYKIESNWTVVQRSGFHPKKTNGDIKHLDEWKLTEMIQTSYQIGWISKNTEAFVQGLRDYRNFVHPWKHLENNLAMPNIETCELSRTVVKMVFEDLRRT